MIVIKMNKKIIIGIVLATLLVGINPVYAPSSSVIITSPNGETYSRGNTVTISSVSYSGDVLWTIQIEKSSQIVWIDQVAGASLSYSFTIPNNWNGGTYKVYIMGDKSTTPASTTFFLNVPYVPVSPPTPTQPTIPTVAQVQAMTNTKAASTISQLNTHNAAKIMSGLTKNKGTTIMSKLNNTFVQKIFEAAVEAGNATKMAELANSMNKEKTADLLLAMESETGAVLVSAMSQENINEAAKRVEEAVKLSGNKEKLEKFGGTLANVSAEDLVSLFREIAGLPETPSTVAELFEVMEITKVIDIVDTWMTTESYEDLALVYSYLSDAKLEEIFLSMSGQDRTTLYPYLDANTTAKLPELGELTVSNLSISPATVEEGEIVTISVKVTNDELIELTEGVNLNIGGSTMESEMVTLLPDASATLTWTVSEADAGTYSVEVNGLTGSFTVEAPPEPEPANIVYESIAVSPTSIEEGDTVTVTVTLENTGDLSGQEAVDLYVDDSMVDSETVIVAGGATETAEFILTGETAGTYTVEAGNKSTTYTVTAPEEPPSQFPWTYVIVAVVIIVAAAYIYMQQQKQ